MPRAPGYTREIEQLRETLENLTFGVRGQQLRAKIKLIHLRQLIESGNTELEPIEREFSALIGAIEKVYQRKD